MGKMKVYYGVTCRKGTNINEMLKEIRAALHKCRDPNEVLFRAGGIDGL